MKRLRKILHWTTNTKPIIIARIVPHVVTTEWVGGTNKQVALHANGGGGSDLLGRGPHTPHRLRGHADPPLGSVCVSCVCVCVRVCVCVCVCPVWPEVPTCGLQDRRQYGFSYPAFTCRFTDTPCSVPFSIGTLLKARRFKMMYSLACEGR